MYKGIKLSSYLDMSFFKMNFDKINNYVKKAFKSSKPLGNTRLFYLTELNKKLDMNKDKIKWRGSKTAFKRKLELLLLKENDQASFEWVLQLLDRKDINEEEVLSFLSSISDGKFCFKYILAEADDIFSYSDEAFAAIKGYIDDDNWLKNIMNIKAREDVCKIIAKIEKSYNSGTCTLASLIEEFTRLLNILKRSSLRTDAVARIIVTINESIEKINLKDTFIDKDDSYYIEFIDLLKKLDKVINSSPTNKLTNDLVNSDFNLDIGRSYNDKLNYGSSKIPFVYQDTPIIALDGEESLDLDSVFSIDKEGDLYFFNVYVSDVPSFLGENRELSINAYKQGTSFYLRDNGKNINYDMLPAKLSHDYLSMLSKDVSLKPKSVISFQFVIDNNGNVCSSSVSRNKVVVDYNLTSYDASRILNKKEINTKVDRSIYLLRDLCKVISSTTTKPYLANLWKVSVDDMIALPSLLVSYYVAGELDFGIYRENGIYTKNPSNSEIYLNSSAPLRRYVDDINLAILLEQKNLQRFNRDDFRYLENNIDEVIGHLNEQNFLSKYIEKNNSLVKKYYLKRD